MFYESEKGEDAIVRSPPYDFYERGCHNMKAIIKQSRLLTTIFLILGFAVYLAYVIVNKANGGRTTDDVIGWIVFDTIVFGAIIVGMAKLCLSFFLTCFIFASSTIVYQIEKLPLAFATAIHFTAIFACWMFCAWLGDWIGGAWHSWLIAVGTFILIYIIAWLSIVRSQKKKAAAITEKLKNNQ